MDSPLEQAQADYLAGRVEAARRTLEPLVTAEALARPLLVLCQISQALHHHPPGSTIDPTGPAHLQEVSFSHPRLEVDRHFALGWLAWLAGDWDRAEAHLARACQQTQTLGPETVPLREAYWLARVRLRRGQGDPLPEYEAVMRRAPSPQATCWYVDLLWRGGRGERAGGIWKTFRGNSRLAGVDEVPLLEARFLLSRGERGRAEEVLTEARPQGGVSQVERNLLLAWLIADRDPARAADYLERAEAGPYPAPALRAWRDAFEGRYVKPAVRLWRRAGELKEGLEETSAGAWRQEVRNLGSQARLGPLAQTLLVREACQRGDVAAVVGLLGDRAAWRGLFPGPPDLVVRAVASLPSRLEESPLGRALATWLHLWSPSHYGEAARNLALRVGLLAPDPDTTEPPDGAPAVPWLFGQAARALGRKDFGAALRWIGRAQSMDPDLSQAGEAAAAVRQALPELESRAQSQALGRAVALLPGQPAVPAELLVDAVALLGQVPLGQKLLDAAKNEDRPAARAALESLVEAEDLPPRLLHHLALIYDRAVLFGEGQAPGEEIDASWGQTWRCWLRVLGSDYLAEVGPGGEGGSGWKGRALLRRLLARHQGFIHEYLARNAVPDARRHWGYVGQAPALARRFAPDHLGELEEAVARFREDLATAYLTATREIMKAGEVREGWRADYARGLDHLRRLLSLDHDNPRLLTALIETCADWFLDCYNNEDPQTLWAEVARYTPFARKLARLAEQRPADLAARVALADFTKFRGLIAATRAEKAALYREALRFNPEDENVAELLAELGEDSGGTP